MSKHQNNSIKHKSHRPQQKQRQKRFKLWLHQWHRRMGLAAATIVLMLVVTGIALNHTGGLELDQRFPQSAFWLWPYQAMLEAQSLSSSSAQGDAALKRDVPGWRVKHPQQSTSAWLYQRNGQLVLPVNQTEADSASFECDKLSTLVRLEQDWLLDCRSQWLLLDHNWQLLDTFDPLLFGIEQHAGLGSVGADLFVRLDSGWHRLDMDGFSLDSPTTIVTAAQLPQAMRAERLPAHLQGERNRSISWQRVLLDLHSGRWFGSWGIWLVDLAALILAFLSMSGFWIWWSRQRKR